MRNMLMVAASLVALGLNALSAEEPSKQAFNREIADAARRTMDARGGLDVASLRDPSCGGVLSVSQDAKSAGVLSTLRISPNNRTQYRR
jgi:hypothetical protein